MSPRRFYWFVECPLVFEQTMSRTMLFVPFYDKFLVVYNFNLKFSIDFV